MKQISAGLHFGRSFIELATKNCSSCRVIIFAFVSFPDMCFVAYVRFSECLGTPFA
jgi:hypothetical protein